MSKSKPCFEILGKKAFRWHLKTWENQTGSIFKLNIKKSVKFQKKNLHRSFLYNNFSYFNDYKTTLTFFQDSTAMATYKLLASEAHHTTNFKNQQQRFIYFHAQLVLGVLTRISTGVTTLQCDNRLQRRPCTFGQSLWYTNCPVNFPFFWLTKFFLVYQIFFWSTNFFFG